MTNEIDKTAGRSPAVAAAADEAMFFLFFFFVRFFLSLFSFYSRCPDAAAVAPRSFDRKTLTRTVVPVEFMHAESSASVARTDGKRYRTAPKRI